MKNKKLPFILAVVIGAMLGEVFYLYGRYFSDKTENPFRVNPFISIALGIVVSAGAVFYWKKR